MESNPADPSVGLAVRVLTGLKVCDTHEDNQQVVSEPNILAVHEMILSVAQETVPEDRTTSE